MLLLDTLNVYPALVQRHHSAAETGVRSSNSSQTNCFGMVLPEMSPPVSTAWHSRNLPLFLWQNCKSFISAASSASLLRWNLRQTFKSTLWSSLRFALPSRFETKQQRNVVAVDHLFFVGPCPPCPKTVSVSCYCGSEKPKLQRCSKKEWSCGKPCEKPLLCGKHFCGQPCHAAGCKPCPKKSVQRCLCGAAQKLRDCASPIWQCEKVVVFVF